MAAGLRRAQTDQNVCALLLYCRKAAAQKKFKKATAFFDFSQNVHHICGVCEKQGALQRLIHLVLPERRWSGTRVCAFALSLTVASSLTAIPSYAEGFTLFSVGGRAIDTTSHYTATGVEDSVLQYTTTRFEKADTDGSIHLTHSKCLDLNGGSEFAVDQSNEFAGKMLLGFSNEDFYKQIDLVTVDDVNMAVAHCRKLKTSCHWHCDQS